MCHAVKRGHPIDLRHRGRCHCESQQGGGEGRQAFQ